MDILLLVMAILAIGGWCCAVWWMWTLQKRPLIPSPVEVLELRPGDEVFLYVPPEPPMTDGERIRRIVRRTIAPGIDPPVRGHNIQFKIVRRTEVA